MIIEIKDEAKKGFCYLLVDGNPVLDIFQKPFVYGSLTDAIENLLELDHKNALIVKEKPEPKLYLCRAMILGLQHIETVYAYTRESATNITWDKVTKAHKGINRSHINLTVSALELPKGVKLVKVDE